jgi:hypothetical protein
MALLDSPHRRLLAATLGVLVLAAYGCGGADTTSYGDDTGYDQSVYEQPAADPAAALEEQRRIAEALSTTSQLGHEARMDAINNMTP